MHRLCLSCTEDLKNRLTGVVPCPFCCGCFRGPEHQRLQRLVEADVLQRAAEAGFVSDALHEDRAGAMATGSAVASEMEEAGAPRMAEEAVTVTELAQGALVDVCGLTGAVHLNAQQNLQLPRLFIMISSAISMVNTRLPFPKHGDSVCVALVSDDV